MNERELKEKINGLRDAIYEKKKEINKNYKEINFYRDEISKSKTARAELLNEINSKIELLKNVKPEREKIREKIRTYNEEMANLIQESKHLSSVIKEMKDKRNALNKQSKAPYEILEDHFNKMIEKLISADIPPDYEKNLFDRVFELKERIKKAKEANDAHKTIVETYNLVKGIDEKFKDLKNKLEEERKNLQNLYINSKATYESITEMRKKANIFRETIVNNYVCLIEHKDKISKIKEEINKIKEEIDKYKKELDKILADKSKVIMEKKMQEIEKKSSKKKQKYTLDELRILMETGKIKI